MCKSSPFPAIPRICWVFLSSLVACSNPTGSPSGDTSLEQRSDGLGTPSPSDEAGGCQGLLPINLGPGVEKQLQPPTDDFCFGPPFIDGQGHLAVDFFNTQYQTASWIILDSSGTQIGSFSGPRLVIVEPQQDGYMGLPVPESDFPTLTLRSWSSTGALLGSTVLTSGRSYSRIAALDPEGGVLVFRSEPLESSATATISGGRSSSSSARSTDHLQGPHSRHQSVTSPALEELLAGSGAERFRPPLEDRVHLIPEAS